MPTCQIKRRILFYSLLTSCFVINRENHDKRASQRGVFFLTKGSKMRMVNNMVEVNTTNVHVFIIMMIKIIITTFEDPLPYIDPK